MNKIFILTLVFALFLAGGVFAGVVIESLNVTNSPVAPGEDLGLSLALRCEAGDPPGTVLHVMDINTADFFGNQQSLASNLDVDCSIGGLAVDLSLNVPGTAPAGDYTRGLFVYFRRADGLNQLISRPYEFTVSSVTGTPPNATATRTVDLRFRGSTFSSAALEDNTDNRYVLNLVNTGTEDLTGLTLTLSQNIFTDNDGDNLNIALNTTTVPALNINQQVNLEIRFQVENGFDAQSLSSFNINVNSGTAVIRSFPVTLSVRPLACPPASSNSNFRFDVERPEDNDDFERGDLVTVDLEVENNAGDDTDLRLDASLYNVADGEELDSDRFTRDNVDDNEEESFSFTLELGDDVKDGDNVILFLKAYDRSNQQESCSMEEISLDVEVPDHKINVGQLQLNPSAVSCGSRVSGSALLRNVGENDEEVTVEVANNDLGVSVSSDTFEIDDGDSRPINFLFDVPAGAQQGVYNMLVRVYYDDRDESTLESAQLTVNQCGASSESEERERTAAQITGLAAGTGNAVEYSEKSLFDLFNKPGNKIPTSVWVLLDVLLVLLIIGALVWLFKSR